MWGDEERENTEREINEKDGEEHENERRDEGLSKGVGVEELRDGEGEQLHGAGGEDREQEREEAKSQDKSTEEQRVTEGQKGKEGDSQEVLHQSISRETTTHSDRQEEELIESSDWSEVTAAKKSQDNSADTCNTQGHEENTQSFLPSQEIHTPLLESTPRSPDNTQPADDDTHAAKNTHAPLSSAPPGEDGQSSQSETVNLLYRYCLLFLPIQQFISF